MTDASAGFLHSPFGRRAAQSDDMPEHRYAQEALARNKREGLELAVKARVGALLATSVLLVYLNPQWNVIWYLFLSFCLILVGLLQRRVGRVGQSRAELGLLFLDLLILTVGLLAPNPLIRPGDTHCADLPVRSLSILLCLSCRWHINLFLAHNRFVWVLDADLVDVGGGLCFVVWHNRSTIVRISDNDVP